MDTIRVSGMFSSVEISHGHEWVCREPQEECASLRAQADTSNADLRAELAEEKTRHDCVRRACQDRVVEIGKLMAEIASLRSELANTHRALFESGRKHCETEHLLSVARHKYETDGICEIGAANPGVLEYCRQWEGRTEKAEAEIERLRDTNTGLNLDLAKARAEIERLKAEQDEYLAGDPLESAV